MQNYEFNPDKNEFIANYQKLINKAPNSVIIESYSLSLLTKLYLI